MSDDKLHRMSLRHDLGLSRRELLRRGAIAGGTLLWVAPTIQSLAPAASAQQLSGSFRACCQCVGGDKRSGGQGSCTVDVLTQSECVARCGGAESTAFYGVGNYSCVDGNCVPVGEDTSETSPSGPSGGDEPEGTTGGRD